MGWKFRYMNLGTELAMTVLNAAVIDRHSLLIIRENLVRTATAGCQVIVYYHRSPIAEQRSIYLFQVVVNLLATVPPIEPDRL
jgi:hypothetical protein